MNKKIIISADLLRADFSQALSTLYQTEVPLYHTLLTLVAEVNHQTLMADDSLRQQLQHNGELDRLPVERHGAIRVGNAQELFTLRQAFAVLGMYPVGYYDLHPAGLPVHSTAFRPIDEQALQISPLRIFTSLLRLDLIEPALRAEIESLLDKRRIFTPRLLQLIDIHQIQQGLDEEQGREFITHLLETFRWHPEATVSAAQYQRLQQQHPLIADIVAFKGPHINHLTPCTLDIDAVQATMMMRKIPAKAIIEGPPLRRCPILLRQTSFNALAENVAFPTTGGAVQSGQHHARFGEIEQRGAALTPQGRELYDRLLQQTQEQLGETVTLANAKRYQQLLSHCFASFPDNVELLRQQHLAWFRYFLTPQAVTLQNKPQQVLNRATLNSFITDGIISYTPLTYEDFLPVSAAGIFRSNLSASMVTAAVTQADSHEQRLTTDNKAHFEQALGTTVCDEMQLYAEMERRSLQQCAMELGISFEW